MRFRQGCAFAFFAFSEYIDKVNANLLVSKTLSC